MFEGFLENGLVHELKDDFIFQEQFHDSKFVSPLKSFVGQLTSRVPWFHGSISLLNLRADCLHTAEEKSLELSDLGSLFHQKFLLLVKGLPLGL